MKIEKLPEIIKDIKEEDLLRAIFYHSINSLLHSSIEIHRRHNVIYPFVIEAVYEYFMMFNENGSNTLTPELFGDINLTIFRLPKMMLDKYGTDNIMTLFYLWQIEDQSYIFQKLYRYDWLFHFKNKKIDVSKVFKDKFGCDYIAFEIFCILMVSISVSTRDANTLSLWAYCNNVKNTIISTYQSVVKQLTITRGEYKKASAAVCGNQNLLTFSLKISKLYPFITNERGLICPMPHTIIPACTSSLLFRLTEGDDILHGLISKEALEEYCYHLFSSQPYYSLVRREKGFGKNSLSSDVLLVENDILYCIEVKAFTPNTKTRLMNSEELNTQVDIVVEDLFELYRFLFINYPNNDDLFSNRKERGGELFISRLTLGLGIAFMIICAFYGF